MVGIQKTLISFGVNDTQSAAGVSIGTILLYAGDYDPNVSGIRDNFLLCNGDYHLKTSYELLYNEIGGKYGSTSTQFNVPNLILKMPIGAETNVETVNGSNYGGTDKITSNHLKHNHSLSGFELMDYPNFSWNYDGSGDSDRRRLSNGYHEETSSINTTTNLDDANNPYTGSSEDYFPKYCAINYIICYKS